MRTFEILYFAGFQVKSSQSRAMRPSAHARGREIVMLLVTFFQSVMQSNSMCCLSYQLSEIDQPWSVYSRAKLKMVVTSEYVKLRVLSLLRQGKKISETVRELQDVDRVKIDRRTVVKLLQKLKTNSSIANKTSPGRPSKLLRQHLDFIDQKLEENDILTARGRFNISFWRMIVQECWLASKYLMCITQQHFNGYCWRSVALERLFPQ